MSIALQDGMVSHDEYMIMYPNCSLKYCRTFTKMNKYPKIMPNGSLARGR